MEFLLEKKWKGRKIWDIHNKKWEMFMGKASNVRDGMNAAYRHTSIYGSIPWFWSKTSRFFSDKPICAPNHCVSLLLFEWHIQFWSTYLCFGSFSFVLQKTSKTPWDSFNRHRHLGSTNPGTDIYIYTLLVCLESSCLICGGFHKCETPKSSIVLMFFHDKPSILGTPIYGNLPCVFV